MTNTLQLRLLAALLMTSAASLHGQSAPDPTGHWKGAISAPGRQFRFEADFFPNPQGKVSGVVTLPDENLTGIPLKISLSGSSLKFHARDDQPLDGVISADGTQIHGEATVEGNVLPFAMRRTGDAVPPKPVAGVALPDNLQGVWSGILDVSGVPHRLILNLTKAEGNASVASLVNVEEGGLELPVVVRQSTPGLEVEIPTGGNWTGTLSVNGQELIGWYRKAGQSLPLTFRHAATR